MRIIPGDDSYVKLMLSPIYIFQTNNKIDFHRCRQDTTTKENKYFSSLNHKGPNYLDRNQIIVC